MQVLMGTSREKLGVKARRPAKIIFHTLPGHLHWIQLNTTYAYDFIYHVLIVTSYGFRIVWLVF